MTLALRDLQAAFAAHLAGEDRADLLAAVVGDSISAAARLRVHRHHVFHSLAAALGETFPTVEAVVGAEFFRLVACGYIAAAFPTHPVLAEYGEGFAAFLAGYPPAQSLPYLADTARLDWALNLAFHAVPVLALTAGDLQALDGEHLTGARLVLQAGAALIESSYPLHRIWAMARPGAAEETVDLQAGGARLLVLRRSDDAAFVPLSAGEAAFVTALAEGGTLEEGAARGLLVDDVFDLSSSLARLLALSTFAALRQD